LIVEHTTTFQSCIKFIFASSFVITWRNFVKKVF
jgi:hypothetical protein